MWKMPKAPVFLMLLCIGAQGKLQAWHREGCPLVQDLRNPLSEIAALNFDFSDCYGDNDGALYLPLLVVALAFRNDTNKQAIAIMHLNERRNGHTGYFYVLLENCVAVKLGKKKRKKGFFFELNTDEAFVLNVGKVRPELHETLDQAKAAAKVFEAQDKWPEASPGDVADVKTNKRRYIELGAKVFFGTVFFPIVLLRCLNWVIQGCPLSRTTYTLILKHWDGGNWMADRKRKIEFRDGRTFIDIYGAVYTGALNK